MMKGEGKVFFFLPSWKQRCQGPAVYWILIEFALKKKKKKKILDSWLARPVIYTAGLVIYYG